MEQLPTEIRPSMSWSSIREGWRCGVGIQIARAELKKNGNPELEFQIEPMTVLATVRRRP